jgi:hypothetical protein
MSITPRSWPESAGSGASNDLEKEPFGMVTYYLHLHTCFSLRPRCDSRSRMKARDIEHEFELFSGQNAWALAWAAPSTERRESGLKPFSSLLNESQSSIHYDQLRSGGQAKKSPRATFFQAGTAWARRERKSEIRISPPPWRERQFETSSNFRNPKIPNAGAETGTGVGNNESHESHEYSRHSRDSLFKEEMGLTRSHRATKGRDYLRSALLRVLGASV